jgi:hypothetical protein
MPFAALAINEIDLKVQSKNAQEVLISWSSPNKNVKGYFIEYSSDAENWKTLAYIENNPGTDLSKYTYNNFHHYKRSTLHIASSKSGFDGASLYSTVKYIDIKMNDLVSIGPNPTNGIFQINNSLMLFSKITILSVSGQVLQQSTMKKGINTFNMSSYPTGTYLVRLVSDNGQTIHQKIMKE